MVAAFLTAVCSVVFQLFAHSESDEPYKLTGNYRTALKWCVSALPLFSAFLLSCNSRFNPLTKWSQLEVAAVRVICEIYKYRARVAEFRPRFGKRMELAMEEAMPQAEVRLDAKALDSVSTTSSSSTREPLLKKAGKVEARESATRQTTRREEFAQAIEQVQSDLFQGEFRSAALDLVAEDKVMLYLDGLQASRAPTSSGHQYAALAPSAGLQSVAVDVPIDDGLGPLNADDYIEFRLRPTLKQYQNQAPHLSCIIALIQTSIFLSTAANAVLALLERTEWMPVVVSFTSLLAAGMEYGMLTTRLRAVTGAILCLENLLVWWESLNLVSRKLPESKEYLVTTTEEAVQAELSWAMTVGKKRQPKKQAASQEDAESKNE